MKKITHAGEMNLAGHPMPCYVTADEDRIISSRRLQAVLKIVDEKEGHQVPGKRLDRFFNYKALKPLFSEGYAPDHFNAITCRYGGRTIKGYKAEVLADICSIMLQARRGNLLSGQRQNIIAQQCEVLLEAFARVGIIALVDEATGYQDVRTRKALEAYVNKFIAKELRQWTKTFQEDYFKEMFRLRGLPYNPDTARRPQYFGYYTNDFVYSRIAPKLLEELKKKNPRTPKGYRKHKNFQWLSEDVGHPRLREHLAAVIALMKASAKWEHFKRSINRALPKYGDTMLLPGVDREE